MVSLSESAAITFHIAVVEVEDRTTLEKDSWIYGPELSMDKVEGPLGAFLAAASDPGHQYRVTDWAKFSYPVTVLSRA